MINVLMYNTHLFGGIGGPLLDKLASSGNPLFFEDDARSDAIITHILSTAVDADVIGLTEVWTDARKQNIIERTKSKYPFSFFHNTGLIEMGDGLLLLSKLELEQTGFEGFNALAGFDDLSQKGMLSAVVRPSGQQQKVLIMLAHTQSGESADDKDARADNIQQLAQRVNALKSGDIGNIILMGDLNVIAEDDKTNPTQEYQQVLLPALNSVGLSEAYRKLHGSAAASPGFTYDGTTNPLIKTFVADDAALRQRLDYIFTTGKPVAVEVASAFTYNSVGQNAVIPTSDHFPVSGRVDVSAAVLKEENARVVFGKTNLKQVAKDDHKTDRNDLLVSIENGTETTFDVNFKVEHGAFDTAHGDKLLPSLDFKQQNPEATHYEIGFEAVGQGCDVIISLQHEGITRRFRIVTPPNQSNYFKFDNGRDGFDLSGKNVSEDGFKTFVDGSFKYLVSLSGTSAAICNIRITDIS